jgi:hypothetical protein
MTGGESKDTAEQKSRQLEASPSGRGPKRPPADTPDGHPINKLAATVVYGLSHRHELTERTK